MSTSTDAILCWGFEVTTDTEDDRPGWMDPNGEDEDCFEFDEFAVAKLGGPAQPGKFDKREYDDNPALQEAWAHYWREKKKFVDGVGVELIYHCSSDWPMYILAVKASRVTANRGRAKTFLGDLIADPAWRATIEDFCARTGIEMKEPKWILCSYWGLTPWIHLKGCHGGHFVHHAHFVGGRIGRHHSGGSAPGGGPIWKEVLIGVVVIVALIAGVFGLLSWLAP